MRKIWQVAVVCLLVFPGVHAEEKTLSPASANAIVPSGGGLILQRIEKLQREIKSTHYSHKTRIDEEQGSYDVDCSGLARFLLGQCAPNALRVLPHEPGFSFARAVSFYSAFTNTELPQIKDFWLPIDRMADLEPGDFIAWRKVEIKKGDNSGHVLIALEKPIRDTDGSFRVKLIDSSGGKHAEDSRAKGESGIGTGVMWFEVDSHDKPTAFRWAGASKPKACPISMGRVRSTL